MDVSNPGLLVGKVFLIVSVASLIWAKVAHWAESAARQMGDVD